MQVAVEGVDMLQDLYQLELEVLVVVEQDPLQQVQQEQPIQVEVVEEVVYVLQQVQVVQD